MVGKASMSKQLSATGLVLLVAGQLMPQMDFSIVNVALDAISISLSANKTQLGLIVSLYGLAFAVSLAASGRLGDRYGRKRLFMYGISAFAIASFICGLAPTIHWLIAARILQGVAAAMLMPQILATIHVTLSGERHSRAIGIYGSVGGLSFVIGQIVGGWLVSADLFGLGWRSVFYINLPLCLIILYFGQRYIPETKEEQGQSLDRLGTLLLGSIVSLLLIAISSGPHLNWNWQIGLMLFLILPISFSFWRIEKSKEQRGQSPLVPPSLLQRPKVVLGCLSLLLQVSSYGGYMFVLALTLQSGFQFSSLDSGNAFLGLGVTYFIGSLYVGRLAKRWKKLGNTGIILCGTIINLCGYILLYTIIQESLDDLTPWTLIIPMLIIGFGNAFAVNGSLRIGISDIPAKFAGTGSAFMTTVQQSSIAIGTAACAAVYIQYLNPADIHNLTSLRAGLIVIGCFMASLTLLHVLFLLSPYSQAKQKDDLAH